MEQYLIDTTSVSDYLSASLPEAGLQFMDDVIDLVPNISIITQIELLRWNATEAAEQSVKDFLNDTNVLDITNEVIVKSVQLRSKNQIRTPDALIAATALAHGYTLVTTNETDFATIEGLKITNPMKL